MTNKELNNSFENLFPNLNIALDKYDRTKLNFPINEIKKHCIDKKKVMLSLWLYCRADGKINFKDIKEELFGDEYND